MLCLSATVVDLETVAEALDERGDEILPFRLGHRQRSTMHEMVVAARQQVDGDMRFVVPQPSRIAPEDRELVPVRPHMADVTGVPPRMPEE